MVSISIFRIGNLDLHLRAIPVSIESLFIFLPIVCDFTFSRIFRIMYTKGCKETRAKTIETVLLWQHDTPEVGQVLVFALPGLP